MAPRGPRGGAPARGARNPPATRSSRGGIQKRKAPVRTDRDGDLDMDGEGRRKKPTGGDANAPKSTRSTRSSAPAGKVTSKHADLIARHINGSGSSIARVVPSGRAQRNLVWLKVKGLKESKAAANPDGGVRDLLQFLERKSTTLASRNSTRPVAIKQHRTQGDIVLVGATKDDAEELLKVNTFTFAGTPLSVVLQDEAEAKAPQLSAGTQELKENLQSFLGTRYVGTTKLLKLDSLSQDPAIIQSGLLATSERAEKMFKALMVVCDELFKTTKDKNEAIESISVANNNIDDVNQISILADTFPDLYNLDLSGNSIPSVNRLQGLKGKFRRLRALYLSNNPLESQQPDYKTTLLEWFPTLLDLNGIQVRTPEQAAAAVAAKLPKAFPQGGPDFRDVNGIGENFLLEFFSTYDSNRLALVAKYYDEATNFSLAVDTTSTRDPNSPPPLPWTAYLKLSRNLTRITHQAARAQRLHKGANAISRVWQDLPATRHPDLKQEMGKYIMDCHVLPGLVDPSGQSPRGVDGIIITIHGEFEELVQPSGTTGKRSFSRTFVLGPGQQGGNPIRVVSDMLSLRAYNALPNVFSGPGNNNANNNPPPAGGDTEQQRRAAMVAELCKQTNMNHAYAELCLSDASVNWDFDKALFVFNERKANLPADAFVANGMVVKS